MNTIIKGVKFFHTHQRIVHNIFACFLKLKLLKSDNKAIFSYLVMWLSEYGQCYKEKKMFFYNTE